MKFCDFGIVDFFKVRIFVRALQLFEEGNSGKWLSFKRNYLMTLQLLQLF